jgi:plastocyanin
MRKSRTTVVIAALGAALLLLGACSSSSSKASSSGGKATLSGKVNDKGAKTASGSLEVEIDDFYFNPTFIDAKAGSTLKLTLSNEGKATHTFTSAALGVDKTLAPGTKATVTITVPKSGFAQFHCNFHVSQGMQGAVVAT